MDKAEIIEITNGFLVEEFEVDGDAITVDANLKDTLGLDSLDYVDLVVTIESNFGVKLGEADFVGIVSFQNFYDLIKPGDFIYLKSINEYNSAIVSKLNQYKIDYIQVDTAKSVEQGIIPFLLKRKRMNR